MPKGEATAGPRPVWGNLSEMLARLAEEHELSVADLVRLNRLRFKLQDEGVRDDDPALARWLAPIFCTSPAEQAAFGDRLDRLQQIIKALPETERDHPSWLTDTARRLARLTVEAAGGVVRPDSIPGEPNLLKRLARLFDWRHPAGRRALVGIVVGALVVGLMAGVLSKSPLALSQLAAGVSSLAAADSGRSLPPAVVGELVAHIRRFGVETDDFVRRFTSFYAGYRAVAPIAAFVVLAGLGGLASRLWSRRASRRFKHAMRPNVRVAAALEAAAPAFFESDVVRRSLQDLGRFTPGGSGKLNVRRSLRATMQNGGFPQLRYGARPRRPEYVLLADHQSPRDHLPLVAEILSRRMTEQKVAHTRFLYYDSPNQLDEGAGTDDRPEELARLIDLASNHDAARFMVLSETADLLRAPGRPRTWVADLAAAAPTLVLNPRDEADWGADEASLEAASVTLTPATPTGVDRYAVWLVESGDRRPPPRARGAPRGVDLPFYLNRQRARLLSDQPLEPRDLERLEGDLRGWLGEDLFRLLRCLAIFPRLDPAFTLALGRALPSKASRSAEKRVPLAGTYRRIRDRVDNLLDGDFPPATPWPREASKQSRPERRASKPPSHVPVLNDDNLLRLVRLPWMRAGRMPRYLREHLAKGLSARDVALVAEMAHAFLLADAQVLRLGVRRRPLRHRKRLVEWLRATRANDLNDPLLIDALNGVAPSELGKSPMPDAGQRFLALLRHPIVTIGVAAAAAAASGALGFVLGFVGMGPQTAPPRPPSSTPHPALAGLATKTPAPQAAANHASPAAKPVSPAVRSYWIANTPPEMTLGQVFQVSPTRPAALASEIAAYVKTLPSDTDFKIDLRTQRGAKPNRMDLAKADMSAVRAHLAAAGIYGDMIGAEFSSTLYPTISKNGIADAAVYVQKGPIIPIPNAENFLPAPIAIYFGHNEIRLSFLSKFDVRKAANYCKEIATCSIVIKGLHHDTDLENRFDQQRMNAVREELLRQGVSQSRIILSTTTLEPEPPEPGPGSRRVDIVVGTSSTAGSTADMPF